MRKVLLILLCSLIMCTIHSSEPIKNLGSDATNKTSGEALLNHNIHTWTETDNPNILICKFCGETWELSILDRIKVKIKQFEAATNIRLEIAVPIAICIIILLITFACIIKTKKESNKMFKKKAEELMYKIKSELLLQNVHNEIADILCSMQIKNKKDYDEAVFIYNDGELKSKEEVEDYKYLKNLSMFDNSRHIVNFCFFFFPFVITFCLIFFGVKDFADLWFLGIPLSLIPAGFVSIITMIIGYDINISNARYIYKLDEDEPSVQKEIMKKKMGILSAIVSGVAVSHHAKKGLQEIADVDSWKEMK